MLDFQAILLLAKPVFKLNMHSTIMESPVYTCGSDPYMHFDLILLTKLVCMHHRIL